MTHKPALPRSVAPVSAADALDITLRIPRETADALVALARAMHAELLDDVRRRSGLLSEEDCATDLLRVCSRTLRDRLLPEGLPFHLIGDQRRYDPTEVLEFLRARRAAANGQATPPPATKATARARARRRPAGGTP